MTNKEKQTNCDNATNNTTTNSNCEEDGFVMKEFVIQVNEEFDVDVLEADLDDCLEASTVGDSKEASTFDTIPVEEETSVKLDTKTEIEETEEKHNDEQPLHSVKSISKTKVTKPKSVALKPHTNVKQVKWLKCELCIFRTTVSSKLRRHVGSVHMNIGSPKKKDPPNSPKSNKNQHDKWFKCALCSYKTNLRPNLRKHIGSVHMKIANIKKEDSNSPQPMQNKMFSCGHCDFRAAFARDLHMHVRYQHQQKTVNSIKKTATVSFKCEYCPYRSNSKAHLGMHLRTHSHPIKKKSEKTSNSEQSPKKDFKCEICPFTTNLKDHLTKHVEIVHTNTSQCKRVPFKDKMYICCSYCNIKIRDQRSMRHHIICKHVNDDLLHWFVCKHCKMKFKLAKYLNYHIARVHIRK